jgi:Raf kinase inhibitor-like YbhB/YbcL family protein
MTLVLTSPAFADGARIPERFTCEGDDVSPPLAWSGAPAATRSFALVVSDADAPAGTWYHWAIFDLPAATAGLAEGQPRDGRAGNVRQAVTDFRRTGYGGPCPPRGHGPHRYTFRLLALDVARLEVPERVDCRAVERAAVPHTLAEARLIGTYAR